MTENNQADLFDYAANESEKDSLNESPESEESTDEVEFVSPSNSEAVTCNDDTSEESEQLVCPCYDEECENWHDTLEDWNIPEVKCGHGIDYLCTNVGASIGESAAETYAYQIRLFVEYLHSHEIVVCDATLRDIIRYFNHRARRNLSANALSSSRTAITNLYKHITLYRDAETEFEWTIITEEVKPSEFQTSEEVSREPLAKEQLNKLLDETNCFRDRLMTRVGVELGPRSIDLCSMEIEDIDFEIQEAELSNTKEGGTYTLPIADELALLLRRWIDTERLAWPYAQDHDYLFPSNKGGHLSPNEFSKVIRGAAERAGIQKVLKKVPLTDRQKETLDTDKDCRKLYAVTPHTLRHTFAELLDDAGLSLEDRSKALDHSGTTVTKEHYDSSESEHKDLMRDQFSGVDRSSE